MTRRLREADPSTSEFQIDDFILIAQPIDDPMPTFGANLVTAPSTPPLRSDPAAPNVQFLEERDACLRQLVPESLPKCLQGLRFVDPEEEEEATPFPSCLPRKPPVLLP
ncbi:hypothetical protein FBEOM_14677 [Fusarium beomiforme]|uniref:Uncharacterized protein n=1 Tax=Fusarium beomiforme TaxID=44412 RepID=A0A9P5DPX0_9HYPO|nr:hypothetical protein FBEOM_14677 [Fusarium beomiforme]